MRNKLTLALLLADSNDVFHLVGVSQLVHGLNWMEETLIQFKPCILKAKS